jgi:acetyl esterase/lipase
MPSWSLRFHIIFNVLRHFLYKANTFERVDYTQQLTKLPNPRTSAKAVVKTEEVKVKKQVIDFVLQHTPHVPIAAKNEHYSFPAEWVSEDHGVDLQKVVYLLHGGAYVVGSPQMERKMAYHIAKCGNIKTFGISYRLAPQFEFPCALIDAVSGYMHLLDLGYQPQNIVFSGASAGGGLVMSCLLMIREMELPLPGGAILMSPWVDLTHSFPSFQLNKESDYLPSRSRITFGERVNPYAPNEILDLQYVSPLWASDLKLDLPILIQVGQVERLYDEDVAFAKRLIDENPNYGARLEEYREQVHVFQVFEFLPTSKTAMRRCGEFIKEVTSGKPFTSGIVEIEPNDNLVTAIRAKL